LPVKPAKGKRAIFRQVCELIPSYLMPKLAHTLVTALPGLWGDFSLSGKRVHVEAAEMEEYVGLESLAVAVAA